MSDIRYSKRVLVEALRNCQQLCPARPSRQDKVDLERIVRKALARPDGDPVRSSLEHALADAERALV